VAVAAALLAVSCGSSPGTTTASPATAVASTSSQATAVPTASPVRSGPLDACALATQSEVDAAAGVSLSPAAAQPAPNPGSVKCSWSAPGAAVGGLFVPGITITVVTPPSGVPITGLPMFNGQVSSARHLSGLGDAAVSLYPGQLGPNSVEIFVATHGSLITLALVGGGPFHSADPVQPMVALARAAVGRFP